MNLAGLQKKIGENEYKVNQAEDVAKDASDLANKASEVGVEPLYDKTKDLSRVVRKPAFWFLTWSDANQAVKLQKMARGLKFQI